MFSSCFVASTTFVVANHFVAVGTAVVVVA